MGASCEQTPEQIASKQEKSNLGECGFQQSCVFLLKPEKEMDLIDGGGEAGDLARWGINSKFCVFFIDIVPMKYVK